jgi:cytochrome P450
MAPGSFPVGAGVTRDELDRDPHPALARLRAAEPVSWLPALGGWLVTRRDLALRVLRDPVTFTVDDPRFTTARVVGPSMLSLDGHEHARHRGVFADAFRLAEVRDRLESVAASEAARLVAGLRRSAGGAGPAARMAELRRGLAGPLAASVMAEVLGLRDRDPAQVLAWYDAIVAAVTALTGESPGEAGPALVSRGSDAFGQLKESLLPAISAEHGSSLLAAAAISGGAGRLSEEEVASNAAVLLFGGIETTEGMISNAVLHLLGHPGQLALVRRDPRLAAGAIDESLRLEPAAALVDRYATADVRLGGALIGRGGLVSVSLAGANRDPAFFPEPDAYDIRRRNARQNLAFAHGPHFCLGAHLARTEACAALLALLRELPGLRLDPDRPAEVRGLVFRKPLALHVLWS